MGPLELPPDKPLAQMSFWDQQIVRTYGITIKTLRQSRGMKKGEAATRLSEMAGHYVPEQAFTAWEAGDGFPPPQLFALLDPLFGLGEGGLAQRAGVIMASRGKALREEEKAAEEAAVALREDGKPPRGRRRRSTKPA